MTWCHKRRIETYGHYPKYATPDDKLIARMFYLPPDKSKFLSEHDVQSVKVHTSEYKIDNRSVNNIWIRSERTLICILMSNSISPRVAAEGHFGVWTQTMSLQQHQKPS